jgi:serine/threonine-protein kinase
MNAPASTGVPLAEGDVLAGKFRIESILGRGGMGVVVAAMHLELHQRVAIKFLLDGATPEIVERFLREARAAVRLKSEHVARVTDVGKLESGAPYMVMEYLEGTDLSGLLRQNGALAIEEAVEYVLHACEAIAESHSIGIVHRDLKPANLFLTTTAAGAKTVKVLDFGISKAGEEPDAEMALTKTSAVLGSPLYMSPEQMKSARTANARSDIWSLGAILFELLAGRVPFWATTFPELILMVNMEEPTPMASFRDDVPPGLVAAILRCLEKDPAKRFANVAEFAWAISEFGPPDAQGSAERIARTMGATSSPGGPRNSDPGGRYPSNPNLSTGSHLQRSSQIRGGTYPAGTSPGGAPSQSGAHSQSGAYPPHSASSPNVSALAPATTGAAWSGGESTGARPKPQGGKVMILVGVALAAVISIGAAVFFLVVRRPAATPEIAPAAAATTPGTTAVGSEAPPAASGTALMASGSAVPATTSVPAVEPAASTAAPAATTAPAGIPTARTPGKAPGPTPPAGATTSPSPTPTVKKGVLDIDIK